ncbi:hypothetical protein WMY93_008524 [Mugilogobius chulae]|uniref:SET domain-containing protein n=1 Tax=Mugilogobius chulae TaxID=88201 RepID=A0AAW0PML1_9GOBI
MDTKAPHHSKSPKNHERQRWHSNCPSAEAIMTKWVPPHKEEVESSATLMKLVRTQKWKYLAVVEPSPKAGVGKGVVTTKTFPKNAIICDYHGDIITGAEGRKRMAQKSDEMGYCFFFKAGAEDLCVDATGTLALATRTWTRLGGSSTTLRRSPTAMRDLQVNEELYLTMG